MRITVRFGAASSALTIIIAFSAFGGADYDLSRYTIDGGGTMFSAGGGFELSGTIGQPDAGVMEGERFTLTGGFWFEQPPGDCNSTGRVNLLDHGDFESCLSGPQGGLPEPTCNCFDADGDTDVDLSDAALFQSAFGG